MKRDKNNEEHALVPSVSPSEASRHPDRNEARIAYPFIAFNCHAVFQARHARRRSIRYHIPVSFFVSSYLVS